MKFFRLTVEERITPSPLMRILGSVLAILMAFAFSSILIVLARANPFVAYGSLLYGAFGTMHGIAETMVKAVLLLLLSLGTTIAFKCKVWNIGGEGQFIMGAIVATSLAISITGLSFVLLPSIIIASFITGALWGALAGVLKAKLEVNEVIVTIMMNYIAIYTLNYLIRGPMKDQTIAGGFPMSPPIDPSAELPRLIAGTRLHSGILIALVCAVLVYVLLFKTPLGYQIRVVGANPEAAHYGGISVSKSIVIAMFLSGGLAGIAGANEICGVHIRLYDGISAGYGYTGVVVALLGKLHPFGVILASIFFGAMIVGSEAMQRTIGVPFALVQAIQGLMVLFVLLSEVLIRYRIVMRRS